MLSSAAFVLFSLLAVAPPEGQILQVAPLARGAQLVVSFRRTQEPTEEIRNAIRSGLTFSLVYKVDLRRGSSVWFDRTIESAGVTATGRFGNLTEKLTA